MSMTRDDAADALALADRAQTRSAELFNYARLAPYLFVTGLLWLFADLNLRFVPFMRPWAWPIAILAAPVCYAILGVRDPREGGGRHIVLGWFLAFALAAAAFVIVQPSGHQVHGLMGLATAAGFVLFGLRQGPRLLWLGLAIAAFTLAVHFLLGPGDNILVMGLIGGGGMMLGAAWLRQV